MGFFDKCRKNNSPLRNLSAMQNLFYEGFPDTIKESVKSVVDNIPLRTYRNVGFYACEQKITYFSDGNTISFPYRVYFCEIEEDIISAMSSLEKMILYCIYSRSCNGYVREKHVMSLLSTDFPEWVIPYIVKVCDEYVIEILQMVYENLKERNTDKIIQFCADNQESFCKSYSRMMSYWNVYYRHDCYRFENYIGRKLFVDCFGANRIMDCR